MPNTHHLTSIKKVEVVALYADLLIRFLSFFSLFFREFELKLKTEMSFLFVVAINMQIAGHTTNEDALGDSR